MYFVYSLLLGLAFVLALPYYIWKDRGSGRYRRSFRQRLGLLPDELAAAGEPSVWVHAVSVGEVLAARPLVKALRARLPNLSVFLSTTTVTGHTLADKDSGGADGLFFAPFDFPWSVRRALARLRPRLLVLVETELWPNLIHEARRSGARVAVVNGRISDSSYRGYRWIRRWLQNVLTEVDLFLMQGERHAERIRTLGAPPERVVVAGNLKFDALGEPSPPPALAQLLDSGRPLWVAGSTMPGEEELVLAAFRRVRERFPECRLVLAPRHPDRCREVVARLEKEGLRFERRTALSRPWRESEVLVLDSLGELAQVYALADVVFVGGSLVPTGGHNVLEAAIARKAIVVGPHMENFREIADLFRGADALVEVRSAEALASQVAGLLADPQRRRQLGERARELVDRNRGALERTLEALDGLLA